MQMEAPWIGPLKASYTNNLQLISTRTIDISTLHEGCPSVSALTFQDFDGEVLEFHVDARANVAKDLVADARCELIWHFPLSRETYKFKQPQVSFVTEGEVLTRRWETLTKPLKERYLSLPPDSYKAEDQAEHFTSQEARHVSDNFRILRIRPVIVDQTIYKQPEVVAESRKKHSDRIPVPERRSRRFEHKLDEGQWVTRELNISGASA